MTQEAYKNVLSCRAAGRDALTKELYEVQWLGPDLLSFRALPYWFQPKPNSEHVVEPGLD